MQWRSGGRLSFPCTGCSLFQLLPPSHVLSLFAQYAAAARAKQAGRPIVLAAAEPDKGREGDAGEGAAAGGEADAARSRKRKKDPRRPSQVWQCFEL